MLSVGNVFVLLEVSIVAAVIDILEDDKLTRKYELVVGGASGDDVDISEGESAAGGSVVFAAGSERIGGVGDFDVFGAVGFELPKFALDSISAAWSEASVSDSVFDVDGTDVEFFATVSDGGGVSDKLWHEDSDSLAVVGGTSVGSECDAGGTLEDLVDVESLPDVRCRVKLEGHDAGIFGASGKAHDDGISSGGDGIARAIFDGTL